MDEQRSAEGGGAFITGATGFIGRHLVERLLQRPGLIVYALVREQSLARLEERKRHWPEGGARVVAVAGDVTLPDLGIAPEPMSELRGHIGKFFHVAGLYDMTASEEALQQTNVAGTDYAIDAAERLGARRFHHVSSIAAAGRYAGVFSESMFDQATGLSDPYFRTKHDSETAVRERCSIPWRIYRPSLVIGHSQTGEMDKVDGPYYLFPLLERLSAEIPRVLPLPGIGGGAINLVPVDFVAAAIDHIAHRPGLDGSTFHLVDPDTYTVGEALNVFAEAAGGPAFSLRVPGLDAAAGPLGHLLALSSGTSVGDVVERVVGMPPRALDYIGNPTRFTCDNTTAALADSDIRVPSLATYAHKLWVYWERNLNMNTAHRRALETAVRGRRVLITGASAGIGRALALKLGAAGAHVLLVARDRERLEEVRHLIVRIGGKASVFSADLSDADAVEAMVAQVQQQVGGIDVLVNNAGRSIRRSLRISQGRFHDFERTMQLNYFAAVRLIMAFLPGMRKQQDGHIVNVSSIGVQVGPPRFSAYIGSKAALDGFAKCAAPELLGDGVSITTVYMPLVKTEMIAPTRLYDSFSMITAAQAADMICDGLISRSKFVGTTLGLVGQVLSSVAPSLTDLAMYMAYRLFPDSSAARGELPWQDEQPGSLARVFARMLPGMHW